MLSVSKNYVCRPFFLVTSTEALFGKFRFGFQKYFLLLQVSFYQYLSTLYKKQLFSLQGIYDPQIIGDKAKWFAGDLEPVVYQVFDSQSKICREPWIDVDYEPSLIFDEEEITPNNDEDDDSSSCHSSVGDLVQRMKSGEINGATPLGPHAPPFAPVRASSPMPELQASFSLPSLHVPVVRGNTLDISVINKGGSRYKSCLIFFNPI